MPPTSKKPRQWLLTVVSAGAILPAGCAHEPDLDDEFGVDDDGHVIDAGVVAAPDGGQPTADAGPALGIVVNPDEWDAGLVALPDSSTFPGTIAVPIDAAVGVVVQPDASVQDAGAKDGGAKDADKDAACPVLINGIIVHPPDSGCMPFYPGIMPRNVDGD